MVVGVKGGGKKISDSEILKTTTIGPLQYDNYYNIICRAPIQSNIDKEFLIISLKTPIESINNLILINR